MPNEAHKCNLCGQAVYPLSQCTECFSFICDCCIEEIDDNPDDPELICRDCWGNRTVNKTLSQPGRR